MIGRTLDFRLISGFFAAHVLLYFSFQDRAIFWYIFSASLLVLISISIILGDVDDQASLFTYISLGTLSGLFLYGLFWIGFQLIDYLNLPLIDNISRLYNWFSPKLFWHYLSLVLIAVPGEEIFWRGFIQKRLHRHLKTSYSIIAASLMYSSVHIYSGQYVLVFAALVSGLFWGVLYAWKRSIPLVIVSHLVFDLLLFITFPLVR